MSKAHALIIDDNPNNIVVLQQLLSVESVANTTISRTVDLAAKLNHMRGINVVFLDLELPYLDGYEALKVIKQHPNFQKVPVIAYTVHVSEIDSALELGFDGFLGKPINADLFPDQLKRLLDGQAVWYIP